MLAGDVSRIDGDSPESPLGDVFGSEMVPHGTSPAVEKSPGDVLGGEMVPHGTFPAVEKSPGDVSKWERFGILHRC